MSAALIADSPAAAAAAAATFNDDMKHVQHLGLPTPISQTMQPAFRSFKLNCNIQTEMEKECVFLLNTGKWIK